MADSNDKPTSKTEQVRQFATAQPNVTRKRFVEWFKSEFQANTAMASSYFYRAYRPTADQYRDVSNKKPLE